MAKGKYQEWLKEENLILLRGWKSDGLKDSEIADKIGINVATLYRWINDYREICEALTRGREECDYIVQNEAFKSCSVQVVKLKTPIKVKRIIYGENGRKIEEREEIIETEREELIPPNVQAQQFWLRNRMPESFADGKIKVRENDNSEEELEKLCAAIRGEKKDE